MTVPYVFLITLREALEAALIVGIVLGSLTRLGKQHLKQYLWWGVGLAVLGSLLFSLGLQRIGLKFNGRSELFFDGTVMLVAALLLSTMIVWMHHQAQNIKSSTEARVRTAGDRPLAFLLLGFVSVFREGLEAVILLRGAVAVGSPLAGFWGFVLAVALAVTCSFLLTRSSQKLNLRRFFQSSEVLLLLFAAGMLVNGLGRYQDIGLVQPLIPHLWNTGHILDETSVPGSLLQIFFGYRQSPSLTDLLAWSAYMALVGTWRVRPPRRQEAASFEPPPLSSSTNSQKSSPI